jgi:hypothetical protein
MRGKFKHPASNEPYHEPVSTVVFGVKISKEVHPIGESELFN